MSSTIVDADSHVLEPADLWEKNLEPKYRDKAIRLLKDDEGLEYFDIGGRKSFLQQGGMLAAQAAAGQSEQALRERFLKPGAVTYEEGRRVAPGAVDPHERIKFMDEEGIDVTVLYPTIGLSWEVDCFDPELAAAYCRVYNDWLVGFCKPYPHRLIPIAHLSLLDVGEAVKELKRTAKLGMKGIFFCIWPPQGRSFGDAYYDPLWAEAQDLGIPVSLHVISLSGQSRGPAYAAQEGGQSDWFVTVMSNFDPNAALASLMGGGTLERFPCLKFVMLEVGCSGIVWWLDRMDSVTSYTPGFTPMKLKPSDYFNRQCRISMEPDERNVVATARLIGAHKLLWAADYPHSEGHVGILEEVKEVIRPLPEADQRKILGENAIELYDL